VVPFTRLSAESIDPRGHIERPNLVVVMDVSLLKEASGQVFYGVQDGTPIIVNAEPDQLQVHPNDFAKAKYFFLDLSGIARRLTGRVIVSAAAGAVAAKCIAAITLTALEEAVRAEISEFGLPPEIIAKNIAAAREAYERAPVVNLSVSPAAEPTTETTLETPPYLASSRFAGPTIRHPGSAALRETGNWRTERPVIELAKCKRCFLCYLYCPEAAMTLDAENFPHVDYDHCKGCMICYEECPTDAISRRLEA
jgi:pyruvate ferredoxin oxidoreductase gamma subunit